MNEVTVQVKLDYMKVNNMRKADEKEKQQLWSWWQGMDQLSWLNKPLLCKLGFHDDWVIGHTGFAIITIFVCCIRCGRKYRETN